MKTLLSLLVLGVFFLGCDTPEKTIMSNANTCQEDGFVIEFDNCLMLVTQHHFATGIVHHGHLLKAIMCLESITGSKSRLVMGEAIYYEPKANDPNYYYETDIRSWVEWRDKHPRYTLDSAKATFERYGAEYGHELAWPKKFADILKE
jgi:hypothetical protein